jgi:hypothetical protein
MLVSSVPLSLTIDNGLPRRAMMASSAGPTRAPAVGQRVAQKIE